MRFYKGLLGLQLGRLENQRGGVAGQAVRKGQVGEGRICDKVDVACKVRQVVAPGAT